MNERQLSTARKFQPLDLVALATTLCLVSTIAFIQVKILPTYAALLAMGGFLMPVPVSLAGMLLARMPVFGLLFLLGWALYRRLRRRTDGAITLPRVIAAVNILAVAVLMAQTTGLVALALHGHAAVRSTVTQEKPAPR